MTDVTVLFWPQMATGEVPPEMVPALSELAAATGINMIGATMEMIEGEVPVDGPCFVVHFAHLDGAILGYEHAVAAGLEDTKDNFAAFAAEAFESFLRFRRRWIGRKAASEIPRLNLSRLRGAPGEEIQTFLKAIGSTHGRSALNADSDRILKAAQPLLERTAPAAFRHNDPKLFGMLRQLKLPRDAVVKTFKAVMQRPIGDDQVLFFQTLPSVDKLRHALMTSQEYLTRFGLSDEAIRITYQLFLNRLPSDAEVERMKATHPDLESLRKVFLKSSEFAANYAKFAAPVAGSQQAVDAANKPVSFKSMPNLQPCDADRVVFLHIPKCGGTTLHNMLRQWFSPENVHAERFNGLYGYTAANLAASIVFSGHYDYYSTTLIPGPKKMISFLRDPMDRLVSLYNFHRAHSPAAIERGNLQRPRWANEQDIDAYFAHRTIRAHPAIDNSIVRYFSNIPQIARPLKNAPDKPVTLDEMLEQALRNLEGFAFVGFMDQYSADMDRLAEVLGKPSPGEVRKHQVLDDLMESNPDMRKIAKQKPSAAMRDSMEDLVRYDKLFYARARELFT